jgi:hypothetical protein
MSITEGRWKEPAEVMVWATKELAAARVGVLKEEKEPTDCGIW